ncbi:MAG: hypothetical protein IPQ04_04825 [Saprospiraceae bacterium]|nr:hypothetical protein [Saprospiraceae bacterium]
MKKNLVLSLCIILSSVSVIFSQSHEETSKKAIKKVSKIIGTISPKVGEGDAKIKEGIDNIEWAVQQEDAKGAFEPWFTRGKFYADLVNRNQIMESLKIKDPSFKPSWAITAQESYRKAYDLAIKPYEKKDALRGMKEMVSFLGGIASDAFNKKDYDLSFDVFKHIIDVQELLVANGEPKNFEKEEDYEAYVMYTGVAGVQANRPKEAKVYLEKLYAKGNAKPEVYEGLYNIASGLNDPNAKNYLTEGRAKHPDNNALLFAEINLALKENKLDELVSKLKLAIEKEPNNISLYTTTGSVYDNLAAKEMEAGNKDKANAYSLEGKKYFEAALEKDPSNSDATYAIGAMYYNQGAALTKDLAKLDADYSKTGIQKYEAVQKEMLALFDKALPYFQKAESLKPSDKNTLIALKEIYAKKNQVEKSNEYKLKLEKLPKN